MNKQKLSRMEAVKNVKNVITLVKRANKRAKIIANYPVWIKQ